MAPFVFGRHEIKSNKPSSACASNLDLTTSTCKKFSRNVFHVERFLEAPFQAPNMLKSSGYKLLINENFNSPALIVKNTAIIPGSSKLLMRFRSSTISIDVWRGGSFLSVLSVHTPEQPVLNSC